MKAFFIACREIEILSEALKCELAKVYMIVQPVSIEFKVADLSAARTSLETNKNFYLHKGLNLSSTCKCLMTDVDMAVKQRAADMGFDTKLGQARNSCGTLAERIVMDTNFKFAKLTQAEKIHSIMNSVACGASQEFREQTKDVITACEAKLEDICAALIERADTGYWQHLAILCELVEGLLKDRTSTTLPTLRKAIDDARGASPTPNEMNLLKVSAPDSAQVKKYEEHRVRRELFLSALADMVPYLKSESGLAWTAHTKVCQFPNQITVGDEFDEAKVEGLSTLKGSLQKWLRAQMCMAVEGKVMGCQNLMEATFAPKDSQTSKDFYVNGAFPKLIGTQVELGEIKFNTMIPGKSLDIFIA